MTRTTLTIPASIQTRAMAHLFPGDGDEHGLVFLCGLHQIGQNVRLLVRELVIAADGIDYVEGRRGYRMLKAEFIRPLIRRCCKERLVYLAVHNHGGFGSVAFSDDDLASHERGYPALLDLSQGMPVGALVYANQALAGDVWMPNGSRRTLDETRVLGANIDRLYDRPHKAARTQADTYARQVLMFGPLGQERLRAARVGVIGAGGVGSLLIEYLARLGVGDLVVADPDRISLSNLSRVVGATRTDTLYPLCHPNAPKAMRAWAHAHARRKVDIARRLARGASPSISFEAIADDFTKADVAARFLDCDFLFLAADSMRARLLFNAIVQQYFIPGIQLGTKIVSADSTFLENAYGAERWVLPQENCLWCSGMIAPHLLAIESKTHAERVDQEYGTPVSNPSVITMNAVVASHGANDFLLSFLGLFDPSASPEPHRFKHLDRRVVYECYRPEPTCPECGQGLESRMGRGDQAKLPVAG